ncbi:MAG: preprotein translocase subunit SecG [bacterium]
MNTQTIQIIQIIVSVLLVASILMQNRGSGLGGVFGGSGDVYRTKRGAEKILFTATIILIIIFIVLAFWGLLIHEG